MLALPLSVSVAGDTVLVDALWGQQSAAEELNVLAAALVEIVRKRASPRVSKVETKLRALVAEAMTDAQVSRVETPEWVVSLVASRLIAVGETDGIASFVIGSETSVRVTLR